MLKLQWICGNVISNKDLKISNREKVYREVVYFFSAAVANSMSRVNAYSPNALKKHNLYFC